jgi:hypothetical protein
MSREFLRAEQGINCAEQRLDVSLVTSDRIKGGLKPEGAAGMRAKALASVGREQIPNAFCVKIDIKALLNEIIPAPEVASDSLWASSRFCD